MSEYLIPIRIFDNALISGVASGVESSAIKVSRDVIRLESITFVASCAASNPDLSWQYKISPNNADWGSYADNATLLASTVSLTSPQLPNAIALPTPLAPYIKFLVSGVVSNPTDVHCTADLWLRMS